MKKLSVVVLVLLLGSMVAYGAATCQDVSGDRVIKGNTGYMAQGAEITVENGDNGIGGSILLIPGSGAGQVGNVGIGTISPSQKFHVVGNSALMGNVGIGTTSPQKKLHVNGDIKINTDDRMYFGNSSIEGYNDFYDGLKFYVSPTVPLMTMITDQVDIGGDLDVSGDLEISEKVGIGITNPTKKLEVDGDIKINTDDRMHFGSSSIEGFYDTYHGLKFYVNSPNPIMKMMVSDVSIGSGAQDANLHIYGGLDISEKVGIGTTNPSVKLHVVGNSIITGNVGIGTTSPQSELAVNGTITTKEVIVTQDGWPDFVFADNYNLIPLNKLEKHIKANKSLPGIPTEKEVLENGVSLGEMQAKLLEKVEELTLYVIDLKKENEELKTRISALER